jgi:hypothetical protein
MATGRLAKMIGRSGTPPQVPEPRLAKFLFADTLRFMEATE